MKGNGTAPAPLTLGATRARLIANGYAPVSAREPYGRIMPGTPPFLAPSVPHLVAQHEPAILCKSARDVVAIVLAPCEPELRARIRAVLDRRNLTHGPCRVSDDGSELWVLRSTYPPHTNSTLDGAVSVWFAEKFGPVAHIVSDYIPLDGTTWRNGDLLTVPYGELPEIKNDTITELLAELRELPLLIAAERRPAPKPTKLGWLQ